MPRFHNPTICTPERCRAVAALHRFGALQLLFVAGLAGSALLGFAVMLLGGNFFVPPFLLPPPSFFYAVRIVFTFAVLPAGTGILAIMAASGVCRGRWWGLQLGLLVIPVSLFFLVLAWSFFFLFFGTTFSGPTSNFYRWFFAMYLLASTLLAVEARGRCLRLCADERRSTFDCGPIGRRRQHK